MYRFSRLLVKPLRGLKLTPQQASTPTSWSWPVAVDSSATALNQQILRMISRTASLSVDEGGVKDPLAAAGAGGEEEEKPSEAEGVEDGEPNKLVEAPPPGPVRRRRNRAYEMDRSKVIPLEVSMNYLKSNAYKETYGDNYVWVLYRRNFSGQFAPKKTRKTCIRYSELQTGNACPICRDEYLVLDYRNTDLLKQFISPYNGEILSYTKTGVCQKQHQKLLVEIRKARDYGTITFDVPFREYDYSEYTELYKSYKNSS